MSDKPISYELLVLKYQEFLRTSLANVHEAVFIVDPETRKIMSCNSAVQDVFGYTKQEMIGRSPGFLHVNRESGMKFGRLFVEALIEQEILKVEFQLKKKDGIKFNAEIAVSQMVNDNGAVLGFAYVVRDIEAEKKAKDLMKKAYSDLETIIAERTSELQKTSEQLQKEVVHRKKVEQLLIDIRNQAVLTA